MSKYLLVLFPVLLFCSEESKQKEGMDAVYELAKMKPNCEKTCKLLAKVDNIMTTRIQQLHALKDVILKSKIISLENLSDADKWMTEIEMVSVFFADYKEAAVENKEALKAWREFFNGLAVELGDIKADE